MATPEEQITPADAAIVTTGTGRKGPEEHDLPESLKYDMDLCLEILRNVLGEYNPELLSTFDTVRHYAVEASAEHFAELKDPNPDQDGLKEAVNVIDNMTLHDAQLLARAFATYFHLANLSEENYRVSVLHERENNVPVDQAVDPINELTVAYHQLINETGPAKAKELLNQLEFHPVFTAHPTEARRKAVEGKIRRVSELLEEYKRLGGSDKKECLRRLYNEIDALFRTSPIALKKPTPVEEADTILDIFDNTLFNTIPKVYRRFDDWVLGDKAGLVEPACPAFFHPGSWIGSDRDGNPNVTADITRHVLLLSRWKATDLFLKDIQVLISELSMVECTDELRDLAGAEGAQEPYRYLMKKLRSQLMETQAWLEARLKGQKLPKPAGLITQNEQLWEPLYACYKSLQACGMGIIANGELLDTLRRVKSFGVPLVRIDIRQESTRHTEALGEMTRYLGIGDYESWSEADKQAFLIRELNSKRPLLPRQWEPSEETREVLDTCKVIAEAPRGSIAAYVISMAKTPSDVLAVHLLLKEAGIGFALPVAPLFETLDDLNNANDVMTQLLNIDWYRGFIQGKQMVMIGYSDSAKDAGVMAASWAQYQAQDALIKTCEKAGIELTLFHGRGGSIGRGGAPAHAALLSQPPGSLKGGLRVTEQGEMIRFKYGLPEVTISSLSLYTSAILEANLLPPPEPKPQWREIMAELSDVSCKMYRGYVRENKDFVPYFRSATPEQELGKLPLGSRPAKRRPTGGVESLRAIPWIFAWTQNRLMLPAWLGAGAALQKVVEGGKQSELESMCRDWPFFSTRLGMLEMVYSKADLWLAEYYDQRLVKPELWKLGEELRQLLTADIKVVLAIANDSHLMADLPWIAESIQLRNIYTDPLNVLQAELLHRSRQAEEAGEEPDARVEQALMVTIAGVAAGMRNTG